jgi:hypothetical protein
VAVSQSVRGNYTVTRGYLFGSRGEERRGGVQAATGMIASSTIIVTRIIFVVTATIHTIRIIITFNNDNLIAMVTIVNTTLFLPSEAPLIEIVIALHCTTLN